MDTGPAPPAHPGMTILSYFPALPHRHCERSEAIQLRRGCPMDCFAPLAMTTTQIHRRRPAQAKRDAGPITTGQNLAGDHRTASLTTSDTAYGSAGTTDA